MICVSGVRFAFGGTPPVAEKARKLGFFERVFDGSEPPEEVLAYLKGQVSHYRQSWITRNPWWNGSAGNHPIHF